MSGLGYWLLIGIPALVFWFSLYLFLVRRYYRVDHAADEIHWAYTEDGWRLALHRVKPQKRLYKEPVILCHGLGANRYNLDWPGQSLAHFFADRGFDVFVPETRGNGLSDRPRLFSKKKWDFTFDHLPRFDAPAIIKKVLDITGEEQVFWLGHSMGGMTAYAYLGMDASLVKAATVLASPAAFESLGWARRITFLARWLPFLRRIAQSAIASATAPFAARIMPDKPRLMANSANMDPELSRRVIVNLITDVSWPMMLQGALWVESGKFLSADCSVDYLEKLKSVQTPMLITVGTADLLSPIPSVQAAYEALGATDKRLVIFGRVHGYMDDYGHGDLVFGRNAPTEVFPVLVDWFASHGTACQ
jgi:pimeloyl-ACP methyl ester carboxylesterase